MPATSAARRDGAFTSTRKRISLSPRDIRFRPLSLSDRGTVVRLLERAVPHDYLLPMVPQWMAGGQAIGGWRGADLVGVLRLDDLGGGEAWIGGIRVLPELRRQGVGRALLEHTFRIAQGQGLSHIRMLIEDTNGPSRALARSSGFKEKLTLGHFAGEVSPGTEVADRLSVPPRRSVVRMRWVQALHGYFSPMVPQPLRLVRTTRERLMGEARVGNLYGLDGGTALYVLSSPFSSSWTDRPVRSFSPLEGPLDRLLSAAAEKGGHVLDAFLPLDPGTLRTAERCGLVRGYLWGGTIILYERSLSEPIRGRQTF